MSRHPTASRSLYTRAARSMMSGTTVRSSKGRSISWSAEMANLRTSPSASLRTTTEPSPKKTLRCLVGLGGRRTSSWSWGRTQLIRTLPPNLYRFSKRCGKRASDTSELSSTTIDESGWGCVSDEGERRDAVCEPMHKDKRHVYAGRQWHTRSKQSTHPSCWNRQSRAQPRRHRTDQIANARPFHSSDIFSIVGTLYEHTARSAYLILRPIPVSGSLLDPCVTPFT